MNELPFQKKELCVIVHNQNKLPTAPYTSFTNLQGDLKTLSKENQTKLKKSILKYGMVFPAFIWQSEGKKFIIDSHQRIKTLELLEQEGYFIPEVPYVNVHAKSKKEAAELLLQANSRYGIYNPETSFLTDFNLNIGELDIAIPELNLEFEEEGTEIEEDEVPEAPDEPISKLGDLWLCGKHRVLCGDCTKAEDVERLMNGEKGDMGLVDPPYGIKRDKGFGGSCGFGGSGKPIARRQYADEWDNERPSKDAFKLLFLNTKSAFVFGGNFFTDLLPVSNFWIVWDKLNTMPSFGDCELIWSNRDRKSVKKITFEYNGLIGKENDRFHPTQKPVGLYADILKDYSKENDIIADFFLGSGTTLIAAHQLNRICYGIEIEPRYIDVILDRYANFTGDDPIREDGVKWSSLKKDKEV